VELTTHANNELINELRSEVEGALLSAGWRMGFAPDLESMAIGILRAAKVLEERAEAISEVLIDPDDTGAMESASYARLLTVAAETGFDIFP
jgi:hypothetical protein